MQEQHFNELKDKLAEALVATIPVQQFDGQIKAKVVSAIDKMNEDNKLLSLPEDEYRLLLDYRLWKASPSAATGIFHWRKRES